MAEHTAFTAGTATEADWALMHRTVAPDGLLAHHLSAGTGDVTVTGSGTVLTIAPHAAMVDGYTFQLEDALELDAADVGVAPTSGQSRIDVLVYEYDSTRDPAERVTMKIKPGVSATTPTVPTLTRTADLWESEKLRYTWTSGSSITTSSLQPADYRVGGLTFVRPGQILPFTARSRLVVRGDEVWVADDAVVKNTWAYRRLDSPAWTSASLATANWELLSDSRAFQYRVRGGVLEITGDAHRKAASGAIPDAWSTVCTIAASAIPGVATTTFGHISAHYPSGEPLSWQFIVPPSGACQLQVRSKFSTGLTIANLPLMQIPVGA
jgi:hypothetical protein